MHPVHIILLQFSIAYFFYLFVCVRIFQMVLFFVYFLPKIVSIPLPSVLDASSQLIAKFYSVILALFGDLVTMNLLYNSIQFSWYFLPFISKYSSCSVFF
jgi:hypothetical protein